MSWSTKKINESTHNKIIRPSKLTPLAVAIGLISSAGTVSAQDAAWGFFLGGSGEAGSQQLPEIVSEGDTYTITVNLNDSGNAIFGKQTLSELMGEANSISCQVTGTADITVGGTGEDFSGSGNFMIPVTIMRDGSDFQVNYNSPEIVFTVIEDGIEESEELAEPSLYGGAATCEGIGVQPSVVLASEDYGYNLYNFSVAASEAETNVIPGDGDEPNFDPNIVALQKTISDQLHVSTSLSIQTAHSRTRSIAREIARRRNQESGFSADNLRLKLMGSAMNLGSMGYSETGKSISGPWGSFVSGSIEMGDAEGGLDLGASIMTAGFDYKSDHWVLGAAVTIADAEADIGEVKKASDVAQSGISLFASFYGENAYVDFVLSSSKSDYDFNRLENGALASGSTDGDELGFAIGAGWEGRADALGYSFFMLYDHVDLDVDGYQETANNMTSQVSVESFDRASGTLEVGTRLSYTVSSGAGVFIPYVGFSYRSELEDQDWITTAVVLERAGGNSGPVPVGNIGYDEDHSAAQLGASMIFPGGITTYIAYETEFGRDDFEFDRFDFGFRWEF